MSRSKKYPIWKDHPSKDAKRIANKKFRQAERQALHHGKEPPMKSSELTNQWDLCDWKFWPWDENDKKRAARK